jgi:hypothetical protein
MASLGRKVTFERINIINNSGIDFTIQGWEKDLSHLFGISTQKTLEWVKTEMPAFYKNCYHNDEEEPISNIAPKKKIKKNTDENIKEERIVKKITTDNNNILKDTVTKDNILNIKNKEVILSNIKLLLCNVNWTDKDWSSQAAKLLNTNKTEAIKFVKKYMNYCYNIDCAENKEFSTNFLYKDINTKDKKIIDIIKNSNIDFSHSNWAAQLGKLLNISSDEAYNYISFYMPEVYQTCAKRDQFLFRQDLTHSEKVKIFFNSNINYKNKGWDSQLAKLFGISDNHKSVLRNWVKNTFPIFYNHYCFKTN